MTRRPPRAPLATLVLALAVGALYLAFVGYGYQLEDEGTILYQILRTYRGERPYLDFHTGYTPAIFYLNAWLFRTFGVSVVPIRLSLVAVNTIAVVTLFRLALRFAPVTEAMLAALGYALFMPFFAGQFASFNIPYPAWHSVAAWLLAELASVRAAETGRRRWLVAAGLASGVAFSFKPNTGVLALGAAVLAQLLVAAPAAGSIGICVETALLAGALVAVAATLHFEVVNLHFLMIGLPVWAFLGGGLWLRGRVRRGATRPFGALAADVGAIAAGFLVVAGTWLVYYLPRLGLASFVRDVLLIGAGVEKVYLLFYPAPSGWTLAALVAVPALYLLPAAMRAGWIGPRGLAAAAGAALACAIGAFATFAYAPEGLAPSIVMQIENASFYVLPVLLLGAVVAWAERTGRAEGAVPPLTTVAIVYALLLFIQLHPRIDFMHIVISMPSALVLGAGALTLAERRWAEVLGPGTRRAIRVAALAPVTAALVLRLAPMLDARVDWSPAPRFRAMTPIGASALPVAIERDRDHELRELGAVVRFVERATRPDEPIVAFPALAMVPFLADRRTPVPDDYFFSGRPDHAAEATMVAAIDEARAPLVVALNDRLGYFVHAPPYYFILRDYVQRNYTLVRRFGRYDVLARRDRPWGPPRMLGGTLSTTFARGHHRRVVRLARRLVARGRSADLHRLTDELGDVDRWCRRAAVSAVVAVSEREGFAAAAAGIAPGRRSFLLLLRDLGEFGDERVLPWLLDTYLTAGERLRHEAATSLNWVLARRLTSRFTLTAAATGPLWTFPPALASDRLAAIMTLPTHRYAVGVMGALAMAQAGRRDRIPTIEQLATDLQRDSWVRVMTVAALVGLGEGPAVEELFETLNHGTLAEQYVPSMILDPAIVPSAAATKAVRARLVDGTSIERETAAWMAPYLADPDAAADALRAAADDPDPAVRQAARWAAAERAGVRHAALTAP